MAIDHREDCDACSPCSCVKLYDLTTGHRLVLEIEVPEFYVDETVQAAADEWHKGDVLPIVVEEWMRDDVGLMLVSIPGEKSMSSEFEIHAFNGRIVGARIVAVES